MQLKYMRNILPPQVSYMFLWILVLIQTDVENDDRLKVHKFILQIFVVPYGGGIRQRVYTFCRRI